MPRLSEKGLIVAFIWAGTIFMSMITFIGKDTIGLWEFILGVCYIGCASGATISIVEKWGNNASVESVDQASRGKAKRSDMALIERLVGSLTVEEMQALRERISADDTLDERSHSSTKLGPEFGADGELVSARSSRRN